MYISKDYILKDYISKDYICDKKYHDIAFKKKM
jgi:hypothetical protein